MGWFIQVFECKKELFSRRLSLISTLVIKGRHLKKGETDKYSTKTETDRYADKQRDSLGDRF